MTLRRAAGLGLLLISLYLFWQALDAVLTIVSRGSPVSDALLQPPTSVIRLVATGLAMIGGLLALLNIKGGAWIGGFGASLFVVLTALLIMNLSDPKGWMSEAIASVGLIITALTLIFTRRSGTSAP